MSHTPIVFLPRRREERKEDFFLREGKKDFAYFAHLPRGFSRGSRFEFPLLPMVVINLVRSAKVLPVPRDQKRI
jgi:hypothetical protein